VPFGLRRLLQAAVFVERCIPVALGVAAVGVALPAHATVQTFVAAVGGQSTCATFSPYPEVVALFGSDGTRVPSAGLVPCGIDGGSTLATGAGTGPLTGARSLGPMTITSGFGTGSFQGSANTVAQVGSIGARAVAGFTGPADSFTVIGADAFSLFSDSVTVQPDALHPFGTQGFTRIKVTVDGDLLVKANGSPVSGDGRVELVYRQGTGPLFTLFVAGAGSSGTFATIGTSGVSNFVVSNNPGMSASVTGDAVVDTFLMEFVYGVPFDYTLALLATAGPRARVDVDADFLATARVSAISVFELNGVPVDGFSMTSASGALFDANGVRLPPTGVPEPGMAWLLIAALCSLAHARGRRGACRS
jgi:hypothetical protein